MAIDIRGMTPLLQVFDMPISLTFYCDVLGFEIVNTSTPGRDCDWALLKLNGTALMLNTAYEREHRPPSPDKARVSAHDDTCLYFGHPDVDRVYRYLSEKGLKITEPKNARYGMRQLYLHDPDGYNLCFQWPVKQEA